MCMIAFLELICWWRDRLRSLCVASVYLWARGHFQALLHFRVCWWFLWNLSAKDHQTSRFAEVNLVASTWRHWFMRLFFSFFRHARCYRSVPGIKYCLFISHWFAQRITTKSVCKDRVSSYKKLTDTLNRLPFFPRFFFLCFTQKHTRTSRGTFVLSGNTNQTIQHRIV